MVFRVVVVSGGVVMIFVMDVIKVLVNVLMVIMVMMMNVMIVPVEVGVVVVMFTQMNNFIVDMVMFLIRFLAVRGGGRMGNSLMNSLRVAADMMVT